MKHSNPEAVWAFPELTWTYHGRKKRRCWMSWNSFRPKNGSGMKSSFCHCSLDVNPHPKCQGPPLKSCAEKSHFEILGLERRVYSFHLVWFPPENGHLLFFSGMVGGSSKNHFLLVLNSVPLCRGKVVTYPSSYGGVQFLGGGFKDFLIFISIWGRFLPIWRWYFLTGWEKSHQNEVKPWWKHTQGLSRTQWTQAALGLSFCFKKSSNLEALAYLNTLDAPLGVPKILTSATVQVLQDFQWMSPLFLGGWGGGVAKHIAGPKIEVVCLFVWLFVGLFDCLFVCLFFFVCLSDFPQDSIGTFITETYVYIDQWVAFFQGDFEIFWCRFRTIPLSDPPKSCRFALRFRVLWSKNLYLNVDPLKSTIIRRLLIKTSLQNGPGELAAWTINRLQLLSS